MVRPRLPARRPDSGGAVAGIGAGGSARRRAQSCAKQCRRLSCCPAPGSFAAACCRRKSIASRMLASRNSIFGMMMVLSLFVIRAVPPASRAKASLIGPTVWPYWRTGSSQPFSTCQSWRDARLVVGLFAVMRFRVIDPLFAAARGDVVRIEIQDLLVFFKSEIVTARAVITVRIGQELLHVLDLRDELRAHRSVVVAGLREVREQVERLAAIRIVAIAHDFAARSVPLRRICLPRSAARPARLRFRKTRRPLGRALSRS